MQESGISINSQEYVTKNGDRKLIGGCINRLEAKELRDFLNKCIDLWDNEKAK